MIRFTMPSSTLSKEERIIELNKQFDEFINSSATNKLVKLLTGLDLSESNTLNSFMDNFDTRKGQERQEAQATIKLKKILEENRNSLYEIFKDLGLLTINKPLFDNPNHILILGAAFNASYNRTFAAKRL